MEGPTEFPDKESPRISSGEKEESVVDCEKVIESSNDVRTVSFDKVTIEKIVVDSESSREILLTRTENSKKISTSEFEKKLAIKPKTVSEKSAKSKSNLKRSVPNGLSGSKTKLNLGQRNSQLPVLKTKKSGSVSSLIEKRISPVKLTKSSSISSISNRETAKNPRFSSPTKPAKVPPKVPAKPKIKRQPFVGNCGASPVSPIASTSSASKASDQGTPTAVGDAQKPALCKKPEIPRQQFGVRSLLSGLGSAPALATGRRPASLGEPPQVKDSAERTAAQTQLRKSHSKIEELQRGLRTKINASTAETYKQRLPSSQSLRGGGRLVKSLDLNENVTREKFDEEFLKKHNFDKKLKIEEKRVLETDLDYVSDSEKTETRLDVGENVDNNGEKRRYSKTVSDIEKRWSGEFLEGRLDQNSSESSKSSYVEELGSISSHEDIIGEGDARFIEEIRKRSEEFPSCSINSSLKSSNPEDILEDTVSTAGSNIQGDCRIEDVDAEVEASNAAKKEESNESKESTLKNSSDTSSATTTESSVTPKEDKSLEKSAIFVVSENPEEKKNVENLNELKNSGNYEKLSEFVEAVKSDVGDVEESIRPKVDEPLTVGAANEGRVEDRNRDSDRPGSRISDKDGYAELIKTFTMEAGTSKTPKEEKKRKGFRRLLPGLFSPKDSRKEYKKEQKERKKREEKQFGQYQQNGNYTRSPDTMNLNEDIKRNVKLNTSLNSSIIEERLNEIKQELFPEQGLTTSTPDHFLQPESNGVRPGSKNQRFYTANSSLSSIAPEEKWMMDQNIISGSPDMRKLKQRKPEADPKRILERKHSLQELASQGRFFRNHGQSGRTSTPPNERYLIRPRAVHPVDRPLPAIPQKIEFSNYENHQELRQQSNPENYSRERYPRQVEDYRDNSGNIYRDKNNSSKSEPGRNQSVDSGFNLTPVSAQVKITRQPVINQNQKAPLIGRSPKYSPSSSQKSGDYADSSYTPNSSQKSEFSPSSSKSGEYYLNSPRASSARTSPDDSLTDRREQIFENRLDPVYDAAATPDRVRSPVSYDHPSTTPENSKPPGSLIVLPLPRDTPEPIYVQRSPGQTQHSTATPSPRPGASHDSGRDVSFPVRTPENSTRNRAMSPARNRSPASPRSSAEQPRRSVNSPPRKLTSPLTVSTSNNSGSMAVRGSPVVETGTSISPLARPMSPCEDAAPIRTPTTSPRMNESRQRTPVSGPYVPMASRRSQPNEQILIASPKRDAYYETQVRRPSNARVSDYPASPVPMIEPPKGSNCLDSPDDAIYDASGSRAASPRVISGASPTRNQARSGAQPSGIQRPEPIYGHRTMPSPAGTREQVYGQCGVPQGRGQELYSDGEGRGTALSSPRSPTDQQPRSSSQSPRQGATALQRSQMTTPTHSTGSENLSESQQSIYSGRQTVNTESVYSQGSSRQPSPSKKQTMQHLEAFYWQQKALESQRKSNSSPSVGPRRSAEQRIDYPEIREAMHWHQLKKLDEEQQRKIYHQQNIRDERNDPLYWRRKLQSPPNSPSTVASSANGSSPSLAHQTPSGTMENLYWRSKLQQPKPTVINKPPIMGQKGQNQPVLIVRPQPVYQEKKMENREIYVEHRDLKREPPPRSKSASPLFARGDERRSLSLPRKPDSDDGGFLRGRERSSIAALRKAETPPIYEEGNDGDKKPPPIFKRGSLISNSSSSVDYAAGQKRVSFSNQTTNADIGAGIWPTKHGMAPEPPTRQHRLDRTSASSESDRVDFLHDVENQNNANANVYGNVMARSVSQNGSSPTAASGTLATYEANVPEYDADRPLPPPPRQPLRFLRRSNSVRDQPGGSPTGPKVDYGSDTGGKYPCNSRRWPPVSESESGSEANEIQRILRRRNGELSTIPRTSDSALGIRARLTPITLVLACVKLASRLFTTHK